jgi:hypothetical protein
MKQSVPHTTDLDVTAKEVVELASPDAITAFLGKLGYDTADRALLSPEAVGLSGESASAIRRIELLSEDPEQFLRVVFAQPKSLTAKVRNDLVRVLGRSTRSSRSWVSSPPSTVPARPTSRSPTTSSRPATAAGSRQRSSTPGTDGSTSQTSRTPTRLKKALVRAS